MSFSSPAASGSRPQTLTVSLLRHFWFAYFWFAYVHFEGPLVRIRLDGLHMCAYACAFEDRISKPLTLPLAFWISSEVQNVPKIGPKSSKIASGLLLGRELTHTHTHSYTHTFDAEHHFLALIFGFPTFILYRNLRCILEVQKWFWASKVCAYVCVCVCVGSPPGSKPEAISGDFGLILGDFGTQRRSESQ